MGRQYTYSFRCPYCRKPYAKRALWVKHIAQCPANPAKKES